MDWSQVGVFFIAVLGLCLVGLTYLSRQFDRIDERFARLEERMNSLEERQARIEERLDKRLEN